MPTAVLLLLGFLWDFTALHDTFVVAVSYACTDGSQAPSGDDEAKHACRDPATIQAGQGSPLTAGRVAFMAAPGDESPPTRMAVRDSLHPRS